MKVRPLALQGKELRVSGSDIATLEVGSRPVAVGTLPGSAESLLVVRTAVATAGQYTVSFDLDPDVRRFLLDQGFRLDGHPTEGEVTVDIDQTIPEPLVIGPRGEVRGLSWKDTLAKEHYEPLSVHVMNGKLFVCFVSSGSHGLDVFLLGDIVALELSASGDSVLAVHPIAKLDGHGMRALKVVELSKTRVGVLSEDDSGTLHAIGYDFFTKKVEHRQHTPKDLPSSRRLLHNDRLSASGRPRSWVVEVLPGTYSVETMGQEHI